jgi:hypothetical protein
MANALAWGIAGCALAIVAGGILPLVLVGAQIEGKYWLYIDRALGIAGVLALAAGFRGLGGRVAAATAVVLTVAGLLGAASLLSHFAKWVGLNRFATVGSEVSFIAAWAMVIFTAAEERSRWGRWLAAAISLLFVLAAAAHLLGILYQELEWYRQAFRRTVNGWIIALRAAEALGLVALAVGFVTARRRAAAP